MSASQDEARRPRLTDRQTAVLAAVERLGRPSMHELRPVFAPLAPSAVARVLKSLEAKGLVTSAGDPHQIYLGGLRWWSTAIEPTAESLALRQIGDVVEQAELGLDVSVDPSERAVTVYMPLAELEAHLRGEASVVMEQIRGCVWRLEREGIPVELSIATELSTGPVPMLAIKLSGE